MAKVRGDESPLPHTDFSRLLELCVLGKLILGYGDRKIVGFVNCISDFLSPGVVQMGQTSQYLTYSNVHYYSAIF